jgi:hypothetical protein
VAVIVLICPGISGRRSGGGRAVFRGVATAASRVADLVVLAPDGLPESVFDVRPVGSAAGTQDLLGDLIGVTVLKVAGAFEPDDDQAIDLWLLARHEAGAIQLVYLDADAASRVPMLWYQPHFYLGALGRSGLRCLLWGGGPRATHAYRALGFDVVSLRPGICHVGLADDLDAIPPGNSHRLAGTLACDVRRGDPRWETAAYAAELARSAGFDVRQADGGGWEPTEWLQVLRTSEYVLNLLRPDVRGFADSFSARVFEAADCGALLLSEDFPGLDAVWPRIWRFALPTDSAGWRRLAEADNADKSLMSGLAAEHVRRLSAEALVHLVRVLHRLIKP